MDNVEEQKTSKKSKDTKKEEEVSLYSDQKSEQILNFCHLETIKQKWISHN